MTTNTTNPFLEVAFDNEEDPFPAHGTSLTGDKRTEARLCTVQAITQSIVTEENLATIQKEFVSRQLTVRKADKKIFNSIINIVAAEDARFIDMLEPNLSASRPWKDLNPVQKAVLLAAVGEWQSEALSTPPKTVLNEFLNISKGFCTPEETAFLNGILNAVMIKLMLV